MKNRIMIHKEMIKGMTPDEIDAYVLGFTKGGFTVEWLAGILYLQHGVDLYTLYQPELDTAASMELDKLNGHYVRGWEDGSNGYKNACRDCIPGRWKNYRKELRNKNKENEAHGVETSTIRAETRKFNVGDKVCKPKGYSFDGIVVAVFTNTNGEVRIVAELEGNGMLHIFSEGQLELRNNGK